MLKHITSILKLFVYTIGLFILSYIPIIIYVVLQQMSQFQSIPGSNGIIAIILLTILTIILFILVPLIIFRLAWNLIASKNKQIKVWKIKVKQVLKFIVLGIYISLLAAIALIGLTIIASSLISLFLNISLISGGQTILSGIIGILLTIFGIKILVNRVLSINILATSNLGIKASLNASKQIAKKRFKQILWLLVIITVISLPLSILTTLMSSTSDPSVFVFAILTIILSTLLTTCLYYFTTLIAYQNAPSQTAKK